MRKVFFILFLLPVFASADINISGVIASDTTWSPANGVYIVGSYFQVPSGVTLTIEPGTIVKFVVDNALLPTVAGTLIARGTQDLPIVFTTIRDDSVGGDTNGDATSTVPVQESWQGLYFTEGATGIFDHVTLSYSGYGGFGFGSHVGIENNGGNIEINNANFHDNWVSILHKGGNITINNSTISNQRIGLNIEYGTTTISNTIFNNNLEYAIRGVSSSTLTLLNNNFSGSTDNIYVNAEAKFVHGGNVKTGGLKGFFIAGFPRYGAIWHTSDLPLVVGPITVQQGKTLTISAGSVLKMADGFYVEVDGGTLISQGTTAQPVYITSIKDDTMAGDTNNDGSASRPNFANWTGITFKNNAIGNFSNTIIRYAGQTNADNFQAGITNLGGTVTLDKVSFFENLGNNVYQNAGSLLATETDFNSLQYGLTLNGGTTTIAYSQFKAPGSAIQNLAAISIDARHNWWGSNTGPNDTSTTSPTGSGANISGNILYDPWLRRDPALPNPVIIVPGIMGSVLINPNVIIDSEKWPNLVSMILPGEDTYLDILMLDDLGNRLVNIQPESIMREIQGNMFFSGLFNSLVQGGLTEDLDLFEGPYDWRLDVLGTSRNLKNKIEQIKSQTGADRVDIVAHSMGGLLVKKYLRDNGGDSVGKFIDIATPHTGSPKAFKALNYGDNFGFEKSGFDIMNPLAAKRISQNMPAVYQLLPSRKYFNDTDPNYRYYVFDGINNSQRLTFDQTKSYLTTAGRNASLVARADAFHQEIDDLDPATYGVEAYNIVGCGTPTIGQFYILDKQGDHYNYNIKMINGDGTVPLKSAEAIPAIKTFYLKGAQHATMPSASGVKELVASILKDNNSDISLYPNLALNADNCQIPNGQLVSFHSPITLDIYDASGNHTGPNINGDIENNIPGVVYEVIEDNKFAFLPDGTNYTVKGQSTGVGSFDARVETIVSGEVVATKIFSEIPLNLFTKAELTINSAPPSQIILDQNGDGVFESVKVVSTTATGPIEGTGKPVIAPVVPKAVASSGGNSSGSSVARKEIAKKSVNASQVAKFQVTTKQLKPKLVATSTRPSNTASAYQAITKPVKAVFKSIWSWFKKKL